MPGTEFFASGLMAYGDVAIATGYRFPPGEYQVTTRLDRIEVEVIPDNGPFKRNASN